ncbi:MAG TPA: hypothetical protein DHW60_05175 [Ruminococcus sp.]|jgi:alpha-tubulin suppressor-like RCC1 family protein|nr:hypothetical protein [Ruminococcus sp.]HCL88747.1 hypothetical protein [Ruminococcus sp.]
MNNKRLFSRFLAVTLAITLIFSVFSVSAGAVSADEKSNSQNANVQDNLSVSGTNSLGTMLANEIADKNEEAEDNNGYNVFSVAVSGNNAVVSFETITDATLLVAIYNESCDTLIATGTTEVTNGETEKNVILDTNDMPQYFYVKGYLIDTTTNKPLCTAYSSPMYTKDMQEFLSKTTDDFEENKVLNFDNDDDNNFAVYKDEVKLVDESGETNKVTKSDDTTKTYVIENIDDSISSLSEGDIFSYDYSNGDALIVKVASITIDGTTATITGEDANLDDVFDYVKIDSTAKKSDFTYDESTVGEGVSILSEQKSRKSRAIDISGSASWSVPFSVSYVDNGVNVKGSLTYGSSVYVKVYLSIQYQYLELKVDQTLKLDLSVSTNLFESSIDLFEFGVSPIAGVYVTVTPSLVIEGSINCSISATIKTTNGFSVSNTDGYKDLTTNPKLETKLDFSGSVFIGAKATLKIRVLGSLVEGGFTLKNGVDISGKFDDTKDSSSKKHNCSACIKGDIYKKIGGSIYIKFLNSKNLKFELSLNVKTKISDFYYSLDHQTFDFTTCPYVSYKVNIIVKNSNGSFVSGASVNGTATTDSDGKVTMYLPNGNHTFTASYNGQTESTTTTVNNAETTAEIVIGTSQSNPDYDFSSAGEIVQVAAGGTHTAAVTKDGDLYMWGRNYYGQLGVYSNADSKIPIKVNNSSSTLPEKSVKYIALGYYHSAAITKDGSLYMWGYNRSGQLGDGTTTDRYTPVKIMDNVASVSLGGSHSAAVTKDGSLYMWGDNGNGRLGDGTTTDRYTPVKIMDNVASVSLGSSHSAAITKDGSLYMWGYNYYGQLGDGTTTDRYTPVKIMDNVASVSLGGNHSAAITKDSNLYMWGGNGSGQLGDGTTDNKARPHRVASNVQSVKLGYSHTTVISKDGGLYTWGYNYYGQLGNGTTTDSSNPIKIMNDAIDCAGGDNHTIVLKKDGTVYTWGDNYHGQLGDDTTTDRTSPVAIQIYDHTNVLKSTKKSSESVSASSGQHTSKFAGYNANGIYNFYALKDKNADKLLSDDNILYVDQVRADSNGNISVTYTPKTAYDSPYEFVSSITQVNISNADVSAEDFTYNGKLQTVKPVVKVNGYTLYSGIDYTLSGAYIAKNAGEYTYTINGKGDFTGSITKTFTIKTADVNNCDVLILDSATYTGKDIEPNAVVKIGDVTLKKDVDYTVEYQNNLNVGIGIVVIKGKGNCNGRKICWFDITNCDISEISKIDIQDCTYYGKAVVPEMALENNGTALVKDKDYTVTFKNNDSVGTATAVINGIGNYSGTIEKTFQIKLPIGDIDMSETIDVKDATLVMQYGVKLIDLSDEQLIIADVNNDNIVNIKDATMIQKYVVKLIDSFVR